MNSVQGIKNFFESNVTITKIASGFRRAQGPVWIPKFGALRWSDLTRNQNFQYSPKTQNVSIYEGADDFISARTLNRDGDVIQSSHGKRRIEREEDGKVQRMTDHYNGAHLNSPHDLVITRDGTIWFTDPSFGIQIADEGRPGVQEYADSYVFRFDSRTEKLLAVIIDIEEPNGLAFSPDESLLYVTDSSAYLRNDGSGNHHIRVYDLENSHCKNGRTFKEIEEGIPHGIRVDVDGNIWTCSSQGVEILSPDGSTLGVIELPEPATNLCFGGEDGRDLYICATTSVYHIPTRTTDAARKPLSRMSFNKDA